MNEKYLNKLTKLPEQIKQFTGLFTLIILKSINAVQ